MKRMIAHLCIAILCLHGIAAPTRSGVSAMHTRFTAEEETQPWYVTDGLVVHFDGIYNVGYGQHSSSTTKWIDLINGFTLTILIPYEDGISFNGQISAVNYPSGGGVTFSVSHDLTLHTVVTAPSSISWATRAMIAIGRDSFSMNGFVVGGGKTTYNTVKAYWSSAYSGGTTYTVDTGKYPNERFSVDIVFYYQSLQFMVYVNGVQTGSMQTIDPTVWNLDGRTDIYMRYGSNSGVLNDASGFRSHSVMLYDRALTEEEIQWNYTLDAERFGL